MPDSHSVSVSQHLITSLRHKGAFWMNGIKLTGGLFMPVFTISSPSLQDLASCVCVCVVSSSNSSGARGSHVSGFGAGCPVCSLCFSVELLGFHWVQDVALLRLYFPQKDGCQAEIIVCVCWPWLNTRWFHRWEPTFRCWWIRLTTSVLTLFFCVLNCCFFVVVIISILAIPPLKVDFA